VTPAVSGAGAPPFPAQHAAWHTAHLTVVVCARNDKLCARADDAGRPGGTVRGATMRWHCLLTAAFSPTPPTPPPPPTHTPHCPHTTHHTPPYTHTHPHPPPHLSYLNGRWTTVGLFFCAWTTCWHVRTVGHIVVGSWLLDMAGV